MSYIYDIYIYIYIFIVYTYLCIYIYIYNPLVVMRNQRKMLGSNFSRVEPSSSMTGSTATPPLFLSLSLSLSLFLFLSLFFYFFFLLLLAIHPIQYNTIQFSAQGVLSIRSNKCLRPMTSISLVPVSPLPLLFKQHVTTHQQLFQQNKLTSV